MRNILRALVIFSICQFGATAFAADDPDNALVRMFSWWNGAIQEPNGFTEAAFRRHFTEQAAIIINGKERVRGIKPMVEHFKRIQASVEAVKIVLPFEEGFASGNRIFTYHLIRSRNNGVSSVSHVMGYAVVEQGRIALVDFLSYDEPAADKAGETKR
ncbi:hypothetical protein FKG94_07815 [Exilibacterium tricleocarpae]|uniref:Nuclear transport factor 2 family protein n=1 Tax=Exilibacterium tricleocarpae TaxID=2591008 RepID=A0A545TZI6_9GAMM|nr:hypothetical protein [Exilibacterium tricleocarpae]TQV82626.1 hypothetical protein FKG94_07815 [Exilibacterium tricleocarpae]